MKQESDFVAGYSWFNFAPYLPPGSSSSLFEGRKSNTLTACGRYYASVTPENPMGNQSIEADDEDDFRVMATELYLQSSSATTARRKEEAPEKKTAPVPAPAV